MILVDTSIWIDHLRRNDPYLQAELHAQNVLVHPFVIGEVAMGNLRRRDTILKALSGLPCAVQARDVEVLHFIASHYLFGLGLGYVDAHLLTASQLTPGTRLWTRDKRLATAASRLKLQYSPA